MRNRFRSLALLNVLSRKVVMELLPATHEPPIQIISRIPDSLLPHTTPDEGHDRAVVALRQGRHLLTTFHPELTSDSRFHEYFVQECVLPSLAPRLVSRDYHLSNGPWTKESV